MLTHLWTHRERCPPLTRAWLISWAKRCQQLPTLLRQWRHQQILTSKGASIHPMTFFSDSNQASGNLKLLTVGADTSVGRVELSVHAPLHIGSHVCINDGAKILTASHSVTDPSWATVAKPVTINDYVWIATNAIILPGVTIGSGAVVGAGAVVAKDVAAGAVMLGNPAQRAVNQRASELAYSPLSPLALFNAWKGATRDLFTQENQASEASP